MIAVYAIRNIVDGRVYIGGSNQIRKREVKHLSLLRRGKHPNQHLQDAYNLYGKENMHFVILEECSAENLRQREQWWLDHTLNKYNMVLKSSGGPPLGRTPSAETKEKIASAQRGKPRKPWSEESRRKISEAMKGRVFTPEWKAKISANRKGKGRKA